MKKTVVYDPFMGTGTTGIACEELGLTCYGSELSSAQVEFAENRLKEFRNKQLTNLLSYDIIQVSNGKEIFVMFTVVKPPHRVKARKIHYCDYCNKTICV